MEQFNIWAFLGGLAMFVFGMDLLEETIKILGYSQLKKFLSKTVNTTLKSIWAGTILAGILQSGTIVSVMTLSFAGAGILSLAGAIGVIVGGNVGGTFLAVIISKLGFGYSISARALPLLSAGGIMQFFQNKKIKLTGQLILAFGLLLFGIGYLKDSVSILAQSIDVAQYASMGWYVFFFGGIVLAALLHSSGTATIIAMVAMQQGIITFEQAIVAMLGASIGSALISLYASMGGAAIKKQVAYSHVGFNVLGALLFLPFVGWSQELMNLFLDTTTKSGGPDGIAWFQVLYNVVAAVLVYPFVPTIARWLEKTTKSDQVDYQLVSLDVKDDVYEPALNKDLLIFIKKIYKFNVHHLDIDQKILLNPEYTTSEKHYAIYHVSDEAFDEDYDILKNVEEGIVKGLLTRIHHGDPAQDQIYLRYYQLIEKMMYSAKTLHDTRDNFMTLSQSESLMIKERLQHLKEQMVDLYVVIADMIARSDSSHPDLAKLLREVDDNNGEITNLLGQHLHRQNLPGGELSALLHLTSALQRSHRAMVEVVKMMYH